MQTNISDQNNLDPELQKVLTEIVQAYNENRLVTVKFEDPSLSQILDDKYKDLERIYIQIVPKKSINFSS